MLTSVRKMFVGDGCAPETRLDELRYVVFDTEFTSLDARSNRLLSVGAVIMQGTKIRIGEQFYRVTNPGVDVPGKSVVVHKLRAEDVERADDPGQVVKQFAEFMQDSVLVGHFVHHDLEILDKELRRAGLTLQLRGRPHIDTARVYRWNELHRMHYPVEAFDERTIQLDLPSVAGHYGVTFEEVHHALADAFVTAQVWQKQIAVLAARGVERWKQLRRVTR